MFINKIGKIFLIFVKFLRLLFKLLIPQLIPITIKFIWSLIMKLRVAIRALYYRIFGRLFMPILTVASALLIGLIFLVITNFVGLDENAENLIKNERPYRSIAILNYIFMSQGYKKAVLTTPNDSALLSEQKRALTYALSLIPPERTLDDARRDILGSFYVLYTHRQKILIVSIVLYIGLIFIEIKPKENDRSRYEIAQQYIIENSINEFKNFFGTGPRDPEIQLQVTKALRFLAISIDDLCTKRAQIRTTLSLAKEEKQKQIAVIERDIKSALDKFYYAIRLAKIYEIKIKHQNWKKYLSPDKSSNE